MSRDTDDIFGYHATASEKRQASADWYGDFTPCAEDVLQWDIERFRRVLVGAGCSPEEVERRTANYFEFETEGGETDDRAGA